MNKRALSRKWMIIISAGLILITLAPERVLSQETAVMKSEPNPCLINGEECISNNQYQEAAAQFKMATEKDPQNPLAYKLLGYTYLNLGNGKEGIENINRAIELYKKEGESIKAAEIAFRLERIGKITGEVEIDVEAKEDLKMIQQAEIAQLISGRYEYIGCNSTLDCDIKLELSIISDNWNYRVYTTENSDAFCCEAKGKYGAWSINEEGEPAEGSCR